MRTTCSGASEGDRRHFTASWDYGDFIARAEAGWLEGTGVTFEMAFRIELEEAVLDFAYDRPDPLLLTAGGATRAVPVERRSAYEIQAAHFMDAALNAAPLRVTMADAARVIAQLALHGPALHGPPFGRSE